MRELHEIEILHGVSHVVAPRSEDPEMRLRISEVETPLDGGVAEFLAAHVDGGLHDAQAKAAKFAVRGADRTSGVCGKLVGSRPKLAELSAQLARHLYSIAEHDERVSDATLAVLLCRANVDSEATQRFLALLKLDPSDGFHPVGDTDPETGKPRVRFGLDHNIFPTSGERLQKCAFLTAVDPEAEYELLVVDRQRRGDVVSKFWMTDFLGAELVLDSAERTTRLYRELRNARNEVAPELDAQQLAALEQVIDGAVVGASVNLDMLRTSFPVPEPVRERIDARLSRVLPDREFDLDPRVAGGFLRRRTYRADNGIRVSFPPDFAHLVKVEDVDPDDTSENRLRRVSFETRQWTEG